MANPAIEQDPWLVDDGFSNIDFRRETSDLYTDEDILPVNEVMQPNVIANVGPPQDEPDAENTPATTAPVAAFPPVEIEDQPQIVNNPDGSTITLEKSSKGWKGSVDLGNGSQPQVYYGKTKSDLIVNVLNAQANATKKIREQNRQIKLGDPTVESVSQVQTRAEAVAGRQLSAEENLEIKLLFESDPSKALNTWFTKQTGKTLDEVVNKADRGHKASAELDMEGEAKKFTSANPTYYPDPAWENYRALLGYISKHKLGRVLTKANHEDLTSQLVEAGYFTATNLEEAFVELSEAGLLLEAPRTPKETPAPAPPATAQPTERIVRTETRTRAGLGIRQVEVSPTRLAAPEQPPSAEDFDSMSDADIAKLYQAARAEAMRGRRR